MIMRNHGLLSVGRSVAQAFYYLYQTENACKVQVDALASGQNIVKPEPHIVEQLAADGTARATESDRHVDLVWDAVVRLIDRNDHSYRE